MTPPKNRKEDPYGYDPATDTLRVFITPWPGS